ncbi:hypothetical protein [Williamsia sp. CHRR-6]|uniref:hypothetical protein n=1 Tax=Williamsia sp. CHRR-6 TaxID=2835871 RepID=UPI001BD9CE51|nr:hypothetical protein [Williamsia sp. CHRR-6]MBT0566289.1 hypothetical protein [Williamsia sp. CHRR-6]
MRRIVISLLVTGLIGVFVVGCSDPGVPPEQVGESTGSVVGSLGTVALPTLGEPGQLVVAALRWTGPDSVRASGGVRAWAAVGPVISRAGARHAQVIYGISDGTGRMQIDTGNSADPANRAIEVTVREYSGVDVTDPIVAQAMSSTDTRSAKARPIRGVGGAGLMVTVRTSASALPQISERPVRLSAGSTSLTVPDGPDAVGWSLIVRAGEVGPATRDPLRQPFSSNSIWNTAIGSGARYVPARLPAVPGGDQYAPMPQNDQTSIILTPTAPLTELRYSKAAWTGADRCVPTGSEVFYRVPMPSDYRVPSSSNNEGASWLMPDGRTINNSGPLARCRTGGYATSVDTSSPVDLYGDGISTSLGGSGISGLMGALRRGEMTPATAGTGVRHALRINVDTDRQLSVCPQEQNCYRWPATSADRDADRAYGRLGTDIPSAMKMGALLAIPASVDIDRLGLRTVPGRQLAWTLQNYGAYITDSTACACFAIVSEKGPQGSFAEQFRRDYGFSFEQRVADNSPWTQDLQKIVVALAVVDNNGPQSIGGGGMPRQPAAPPVTPAR